MTAEGPARRLSVKKERLTELATDDLHRVVGAAEAPPTLPLKECLNAIRTLQGCTTANICPRPDTA